MADRYEAIGCGVYIVDPSAKPGDPDERHAVACTGDDIEDPDEEFAGLEQLALAIRIAASLNGSADLIEALNIELDYWDNAAAEADATGHTEFTDSAQKRAGSIRAAIAYAEQP